MAFTMLVGLVMTGIGWLWIQVSPMPTARTMKWHNYAAVLVMLAGMVVFVVGLGALAWKLLP